MTPMQDIIARMPNGDIAYVPIYNDEGSYRADIDYQVAGGPGFDPHTGPVTGSARTAFDWMIGTLVRIAAVRSTTVDTLDNPNNAELLSIDDQKAILQARRVGAVVLLNGAPT